MICCCLRKWETRKVTRRLPSVTAVAKADNKGEGEQSVGSVAIAVQRGTAMAYLEGYDRTVHARGGRQVTIAADAADAAAASEAGNEDVDGEVDDESE